MEESFMTEVNNNLDLANKLNDNWILWAHLPHDTDWSVKSYKKIMKITYIEEAITLYETLPEKMIKNCMLFLMREGIQPIWEDPKNRSGGCFSFKVNNKTVESGWKNLSYSVLGESLSNDSKFASSITGITISPKKNFCIVKVWLSNCEFQESNLMITIPGLSSYGCLFKRHLPITQ